MPYPCFKCDVELVAGARFCHQCGAPNLLEKTGRRGRPTREAPVEEEERYRIKRDIQEAATVPTGTRMLQTVLPPSPSQSRVPIKPTGLGVRLLATRFWARWWLWASICGVAFLAVSSSIIVEMKDRLQEGGELSRALTRLAARCPKDSKSQLLGYATKIHGTLRGQHTVADAAELLDMVAQDVPIADGSCAHIADRLAKPDRFTPLAQ
jgi:hypothetical protein